jgi:signal transduction histidine kinase
VPRSAPLRLDLLAEEIAAAVRPESVEVIAEPADSVVVDGDMALLRQAVENVVRNAARRSQRVELLTTCEKGDGVISVVDNGPGFDPAVLPKVFERYQRGDRKGEAGIGLAIVKAIAVAHGGTVEARNNDGGGATVAIRVPLTKLS